MTEQIEGFIVNISPVKHAREKTDYCTAKIETQRHKIHHVVCFVTQKFHSQLEKCASNQTAVCLKNVSLKPGRFDPSVPEVTLTQKSMISASATIRRAKAM